MVHAAQPNLPSLAAEPLRKLKPDESTHRCTLRNEDGAHSPRAPLTAMGWWGTRPAACTTAVLALSPLHLVPLILLSSAQLHTQG
jgi:hypothetical protein